MSQLSTFYPNPINAAELGVGAANNVTFGSIQNTPIGSTTPNTGVFTALTAPAYNMTSGGAVALGASPTTTSLGTGAVNIQPSRSNANQVAADVNAVVIGTNARSHDGSTTGSQVVIGATARAQYRNGVAVGNSAFAQEDAASVGNGASASQSASVAIGSSAAASAPQAVALGRSTVANGDLATALGPSATASAFWSTACGTNTIANLRGMFATRPFNAVFWGGTTTDATANVELFLDATSPNRMTVANNTALVADILIIGNSTASSKSYWASRRVAIRKDTGNVALIGAVAGTEGDSTASTPWSFTIDADTTNQALRIRVTGELSTSITWRATAFYRVV